MKVKRIRRRWKVLTVGILALICIGISFNLWFVQNTNALIESLVSNQSNGRIQLQLSKSTFHYLNRKIVLYDATFYSKDTTGSKTNYAFRVPKLDLKIRSFWSFLVYNELLIDFIDLKAPEVTVTRLTKSAKQEKETVSIPEEIGRIYNSILDALQVLQVKRFQIDEGRFTLVNKIDPQQPITTISNIHFHINNLNITADSSAAKKFLYSDNIVLRVENQDIAFPDGVHHMSFKNLLINVRSKQVQVDSCWLRAETQNDRNTFRIFFDVLKMTNLDFAALYKKSLIKADSVYINNPDIELALDIKRKKVKGKKLELDTIIQRFTGDLDLNYIGVENAVVNIVANRGDTTTTFRSNNDNFKMYGLRINNDSAQPVHVDEFAMILRKYETYSRDSSTLYRFDSLRFTNNKVRLSNFSIQSIAPATARGSIYYSIPAFELSGLSWEDLLFDRYISADRAILYNPEIQYSMGTAYKAKQKASLFRILSGLNESINLAEVEIRNGNLTIQLPAGKRLDLQHVNLVLASNKLLASKTYTGMQQAINELAFQNAVFTTGNLRAELINLQYADRLYADALRVTNKSKTFVAQANGISLNDLIWNNEAKSVFVDRLSWENAAITVKSSESRSRKELARGLVELSNVTGNNTAITIYAKDKIIKTNLDKLKLDALVKDETGAFTLNGFVADGKALAFNAAGYNIKSGTYHIIDNGTSRINNISFLKASYKDTISVSIPQTFFKTHIEELIKGQLRFDGITLREPVFNFATNAAIATYTVPVQSEKLQLPLFSIAALTILDPVVNYTKQDTVLTNIKWLNTGIDSSNNHLIFYAVHTLPHAGTLIAEKGELSGNKILFIRNGKPFGIDSGLVRLRFNDIRMESNFQWKAHLQEALFQNPISFSLKAQGGIGVDEARIRNLTFTSENITNVYHLLQSNPAMQLQMTNGSLINKASHLQWKDLRYSQANGTLSADSFSYQPALPRDSAIAKAPGQIDYMHAVLKNITATGINLTALEKDSIFQAQSIVVNGSNLEIYRDKRKPFISKNLRALPVWALQQMPTKFAVDTLALNDANIIYTEMSDKTGQEGSISVNRINAQLFPVRNINITAQDSLSLWAEGYVMDSAGMRLRLKESYTDSLGTFTMTLRVKPTGLNIFNPALMPLASVKIASGKLDSITMRAVGNEYVSIGEMKMHYKDLKIQFLKKGSQTKKTFLTGLITFAANNFVIRKNNNRRIGTVYFMRNRDRSVFNFLIKSAMSGIASSVGAKKNKKYYRQYKRQQKAYKLPSVELS